MSESSAAGTEQRAARQEGPCGLAFRSLPCRLQKSSRLNFPAGPWFGELTVTRLKEMVLAVPASKLSASSERRFCQPAKKIRPQCLFVAP